MITLASLDWGTGPKIPFVFAYEHQRSGADMQYRAKVTINPITSANGHFGYPIYLKLTIGGTLRETTTLKAASPDRWTSAITYTSPWYTVAGKTSGTTVVSFNIYSGSGSTRNETYSYSMAVDPAASLLASPNGTLGTALTLTVTKYNTAFTHTITYKCGAATGTVSTTASATSVSWGTSNGNTVALAAQNTAGKSVTVTFTIITYSGTTEVGRNTASCLMTIPNTVKPSVALTVADAAGLLATYGAYVQGKSKLTITATPTLAYGSPIKVYEITADGKTYNTSPVTTDVIQGIGTLEITAKVTDNRTYPSNVAKTNITVLQYAPPAVTVTAYRCNSSGAADQEGAYMKFGFSATISSLNSKNSATYSISYKAGSGAATKVTGSGLSYTSAVIACDVAQNWTIEVTVTDKLSSTVKAAVIPIAFTLMDFYNTGKGVAFGKVATRDGFDCAMPAYFSGSAAFSGPAAFTGGVTVGGKAIGDYVVSRTTSAIAAKGMGAASKWYITKWASGFCELHASVTFTGAAATASNWGGLYSAYLRDSSLLYPVNFSEKPACFVTFDTSSYNCWLASLDELVSTTARTPMYQVVRPTAGTITITLYYYVRGFLAA